VSACFLLTCQEAVEFDKGGQRREVGDSQRLGTIRTVTTLIVARFWHQAEKQLVWRTKLAQARRDIGYLSAMPLQGPKYAYMLRIIPIIQFKATYPIFLVILPPISSV